MLALSQPEVGRGAKEANVRLATGKRVLRAIHRALFWTGDSLLGGQCDPTAGKPGLRRR